MSFALSDHTIFLTLAGSQAHGTAREGSDVDVRGVCVAPLSTRLSLCEEFEQHEGALGPELERAVQEGLEARPEAAAGAAVKLESVIFDVAKFLKLCVAANPNALEILFADERDWLLETPTWRLLFDARHLFLTKKVQSTFLGYALAQLRRIETHRAWLLNPPKVMPTRQQFGLPEAGTLNRDDRSRIEQALADKIRDYGVDDLDMPKPTRIALKERLEQFHCDVLAASDGELEDRMRAVASHALSLPPGVVATLNAERRYRGAMKQWDAFLAWKENRNPARAELERKHGYDTKHAMHLIRLMRTGLEVLERGELRVRRPDSAELTAIRDGALPFDELLEMAKSLRAKMDDAAERSPLPDDVDRERVDALAFVLMREGCPGSGQQVSK